MSQTALAEATDVAERTIRRIERGSSQDSPSLEILESYLGIDPDAADGETEMPDAGDSDAFAADVRAMPTGALWAQIDHLMAETKRRLAILEAEVAPQDRSGQRQPLLGQHVPLPEHLLDSQDGKQSDTGT